MGLTIVATELPKKSEKSAKPPWSKLHGDKHRNSGCTSRTLTLKPELLSPKGVKRWRHRVNRILMTSLSNDACGHSKTKRVICHVADIQNYSNFCLNGKITYGQWLILRDKYSNSIVRASPANLHYWMDGWKFHGNIRHGTSTIHSSLFPTFGNREANVTQKQPMTALFFTFQSTWPWRSNERQLFSQHWKG